MNSHHKVWLFASWLLAGCLSGPVSAQPAKIAECQALDGLLNAKVDASSQLQNCLNALPANAHLSLGAGTLVLQQPIVFRKPVDIGTSGKGASSAPCAPDGDAGCLTLLSRPTPATRQNGVRGLETRPITIAAAGIKLDHIVIEGSKNDPQRALFCGKQGEAARTGGLVGVAADHFTMTNSVVRLAPCNGAISVLAGNDGFVFKRNFVGFNGDHSRARLWGDGLTVMDSKNAVIENNVFVDNTDVQLIVGGCSNCSIRGNVLKHTGKPAGGSYAAMMLAGWPNTSGDFSGSIFEGNKIDCSAQRSCGFGLIYGGTPWYVSSAKGGVVRNNTIVNAELGISVSDANGEAAIENNTVQNSGGQLKAACGSLAAGDVNVSEKSRGFVREDKIVSNKNARISHIDFTKCLLNQPTQ